jgi:hypothetical protein
VNHWLPFNSTTATIFVSAINSCMCSSFSCYCCLRRFDLLIASNLLSDSNLRHAAKLCHELASKWAPTGIPRVREMSGWVLQLVASDKDEREGRAAAAVAFTTTMGMNNWGRQGHPAMHKHVTDRHVHSGHYIMYSCLARTRRENNRLVGNNEKMVVQVNIDLIFK